MAVSIQKRGRRLTATVRYKGSGVSSTFSSRLLAEQWAERVKKEIENCLANGVSFDPKLVKVSKIAERGIDSSPALNVGNPAKQIQNPNQNWTLKRTAEEYLKNVTDTKKSYASETRTIRRVQNSDLALKPIREITAENIYDYLYGLRHHITGKPLATQSIRNIAYLLSSIFEHARRKKFQGGFDIEDLSNPVRTILLPPPSKATKQRCIAPEIIDHFFQKLSKERSPLAPAMTVFMTLALYTGMRRSEIIGLKYRDLQRTGYGFAVYLEDTKSGYPRTVYLNEICKKALDSLIKQNFDDPSHNSHPLRSVFPFSKDFASHKFREIMTDLGYPEIRLHDLRHTALSNMANAGLSLKELMNQSGHRTAAVASRYLHVDERTIREKLNKISA